MGFEALHGGRTAGVRFEVAPCNKRFGVVIITGSEKQWDLKLCMVDVQRE